MNGNTNTTTGVGHIDTFQEALKVPHLEVTLPHNTVMNGVEETLAEACCGLLLGERPSVFVDRKSNVAVIPVPGDRIERVLYKSYILHKATGARYPCAFRMGAAGSAVQKKITIELPGAKFAWLKAQSHIRERLYSYEPLIRVNWQQCTGAEVCKIHLHYSSDAEPLLDELQALREWIEDEAQKVVVRSFPLYVPPRNRFGLSSDPKFREIAYTHGVSLWTRTMKDSPLGNEWCTLATDDALQMEATLVAYVEYGQSTKWGAKSSSSSPSQSPPESTNPSPIRAAANANRGRVSASSSSSSSLTHTAPAPRTNTHAQASATPVTHVHSNGGMTTARRAQNPNTTLARSIAPSSAAALSSNTHSHSSASAAATPLDASAPDCPPGLPLSPSAAAASPLANSTSPTAGSNINATTTYSSRFPAAGSAGMYSPMGFAPIGLTGDSTTASTRSTWDRFLLPCDVSGLDYFPAAASPASFATPTGVTSDWNSFFYPSPSPSDLLDSFNDSAAAQILGPEDAMRFISLTDSNSG